MDVYLGLADDETQGTRSNGDAMQDVVDAGACQLSVVSCHKITLHWVPGPFFAIGPLAGVFVFWAQECDISRAHRYGYDIFWAQPPRPQGYRISAALGI
jgi:hypothetical protein